MNAHMERKSIQTSIPDKNDFLVFKFRNSMIYKKVKLSSTSFSEICRAIRLREEPNLHQT
jgi:hypothetical protein